MSSTPEDNQIPDDANNLAEVLHALKAVGAAPNPDKPEGSVLGIDGQWVKLGEERTEWDERACYVHPDILMKWAEEDRQEAERKKNNDL